MFFRRKQSPTQIDGLQLDLACQAGFPSDKISPSRPAVTGQGRQTVIVASDKLVTKSTIEYRARHVITLLSYRSRVEFRNGALKKKLVTKLWQFWWQHRIFSSNILGR